MTRPTWLRFIVCAAVVFVAGCGGAPDVGGLRASFAQQLAANPSVRGFQQNADDLRFSGPGVDGKDVSSWRVHIDAAAVEPNTDPAQPYKGVVKSSWFADDRIVMTRGRDSNLPIGLTSNGLAQECWALWDKAAGKWSW